MSLYKTSAKIFWLRVFQGDYQLWGLNNLANHVRNCFITCLRRPSYENRPVPKSNEDASKKYSNPAIVRFDFDFLTRKVGNFVIDSAICGILRGKGIDKLSLHIAGEYFVANPNDHSTHFDVKKVDGTMDAVDKSKAIKTAFKCIIRQLALDGLPEARKPVTLDLSFKQSAPDGHCDTSCSVKAEAMIARQKDREAVVMLSYLLDIPL